MNNRCNICGEEVEYNGGCALQIAFCRKHSTSLATVSFCAECCDKWLKKPLSMLNHAAGLKLILDEQEADYEGGTTGKTTMAELCNVSVDDYFKGDNPKQETITAWNRRTKIETVLSDRTTCGNELIAGGSSNE